MCVIGNTRSGDTHAMRTRSVLARTRQVEQLAAKFNIKFEDKYSTQTRAVYNYCFKLPRDARKFFTDLNEA